MKGYGGRLLFVDCTTGATRVEPLGRAHGARAARRQRPRRAPAARPRARRHRRLRSRQRRRLRGRARHRHDGARQQPRVRGRQVAAHRALLRLDLRRPLPRHAQAHRLRRRRDHRPRAGAVLRARRPSTGARAEAGAPISGGRRRATRCTRCSSRRGRRRRRDRHRPGRRAARALRGHGPLLEEPRGRVGARRASAPCSAARTSRRWWCAGARKTEVADAGGAQGAARGDARAAARPARRRCTTFGTPFLVGPDQRAGRARRLQPAPGDLRRGARRRRRGDEGALPRPRHDLPEVPGGVRQAVRDPRRRVRGPQGEDARVRDDLRARLHARHRATRRRSSWPTTSATCSGWTRSRWASRWPSSREALERGWLEPAEVGVPFGWGDWRGMLRLVEMTARARGLRRPPGRGRLAARRVGPSRGHAARLRGQAPRAARALGARAQGPVDRLRDGHARRQPPRHAPDAAVRAELRPARHRRTSPPSPCGASTSPRVGDSLVLCRFTSERGFGLFVGRAVRARWCAPSPAGT